MLLSRIPSFLACAFVLTENSLVHANGVLRNGAGAHSMALGGAVVAHPADPLSAMSANPAGLAGFSRSAAGFGVVSIYADATFSSRVDGPVGLTRQWGVAPEIAVGIPLENTPVTLGLSVIPEVMRRSEWRYTDAPGGLDGNTSYGFRPHHAGVIGVRLAAGAGIKINDQWSAGASLGMSYQNISLHAPFIFQSFAPLRGIKTPLDLETRDNDAWNGDIGVLFHATKSLTLGLNYRTATGITSEGRATGNADVQLENLGLGNLRSDFRYDAVVETGLPQSLALGAQWKAGGRLHFSGQVEWVNWSDSFDTLVIHLSNGNNADINAIAGGDTLTDRVPLDWDDAFVLRLGVEYSPAERWWLRAGYAYGANPIPSRNTTPLNAAVSEHTLTAGVGYEGESFRADFAWQYDLPHAGRTGESGILDGEYSNTSTSLRAQWFGLTYTRFF